MSMLQNISKRILTKFAESFGSAPGVEFAPAILENPTEEIADAMTRGRGLKLFGASAQGTMARNAIRSMERTSGDIRFEENYLFSTRRYPRANNNVFPAGSSIPAGDNLYFAVPVGNDGASAGFPTGFEMSQTETNQDIASQAPQGKGFKIFQEGISFNTEALHQDIEQILDSGSFEYSVQGGQFNLKKGALRMWPGGQGVSGFSAVQGAETAHNGIADPRATRTLRFPRVIKPLQNFNYKHSVPRGFRATNGADWQLSAFTLCTVWLWGHQLDAIPG